MRDLAGDFLGRFVPFDELGFDDFGVDCFVGFGFGFALGFAGGRGLVLAGMLAALLGNLVELLRRERAFTNRQSELHSCQWSHAKLLLELADLLLELLDSRVQRVHSHLAGRTFDGDAGLSDRGEVLLEFLDCSNPAVKGELVRDFNLGRKRRRPEGLPNRGGSLAEVNGWRWHLRLVNRGPRVASALNYSELNNVVLSMALRFAWRLLATPALCA